MRKYLLWLAAVSLAGSLKAAEHKFDFSTAPLNEPPPGCFNTVAGTGKPGTWKVIMDEVPLPPSPLNPNGPGAAKQSVVAQLASDITDEHFPMLIVGNDSYGDFTFTVRFKIVDGVTEQMAGIAFRVQDEKNFYVIRASSLGSTFYFYKVEKGVRDRPHGNNMKIEKGVWHDLSLDCKGTQFNVLLDGKAVMPTINDPTFSSGRIAFWTKSDAISYFTDAKIAYTPKEPFIQMLVRDTLKDYPRLMGLKVFVMPPKSTRARLVASDDVKEIGQPGAESAADVINRGIPYYGKEKETVFVTLPLRDRNGDCVAAVRVVLKRVAGQTEENARYRALPVVKKMQERVSAVDSILQ
jgi:hypothetical protein